MVIAAELEQPFPASNCNSGIAGLELSCPNQPGCCSGGALCCAGGCCALTATCVNIGQADEGCCDALDPTLCGTVAPNSVSCQTSIFRQVGHAGTFVPRDGE